MNIPDEEYKDMIADLYLLEDAVLMLINEEAAKVSDVIYDDKAAAIKGMKEHFTRASGGWNQDFIKTIF